MGGFGQRKWCNYFSKKNEKQYDGFRDLNSHLSSNSQLFNKIMIVLSMVMKISLMKKGQIIYIIESYVEVSFSLWLTLFQGIWVDLMNFKMKMLSPKYLGLSYLWSFICLMFKFTRGVSNLISWPFIRITSYSWF